MGDRLSARSGRSMQRNRERSIRAALVARCRSRVQGMMMRRPGPGPRVRRFVSLSVLVFLAGLLGPFLQMPYAMAAATCGSSSGHTICVTLPSTTLTGDVAITVTNTPNRGTVLYTWVPARALSGILLMTQDGRAGLTGNYSFTWPTTKYLDASGVLTVQISGGTAVTVDATLKNGNAKTIVYTPSDWQSFLPQPWTGASDPVVPGAGDGADGLSQSNQVASLIAGSNPPLALYLGDVYETGTYVENRNHYGQSSMDAPGAGTLWGAFAHVTQPTLGNHGSGSVAAFVDYWHQRPLYTSFDFGGVRFLGLNSTEYNGFQQDSAQYTFVQDQLATAPACVIAYYHHPALNVTTVNNKSFPMWQLLASGGADLVLNGHVHYMAEYEPLDANLQTSSQAHLVQLSAGAGGHTTAAKTPQGHMVWSPSTATPGAAFVTLVGAANGGTATSLGWQFKDSSGNVLRTGTVECNGP